MIWIFHFICIHLLLLAANIFNKKNIFIYGTFFYSIFIFGQRWMTGEDYPYYLLYYLNDFQVREPLYYFLQNIFSEYDLYFGLLIFIIYFITLMNNYRFIMKFGRSKIFIIYIFMFMELYFIQMSQIRQLLAVSFFINAYFYMFEGKKGKVIINLIVASLFHISALLVAPFLLLKLNLNKKKVFCILIFILFIPIVNIKFILNLEIFQLYAHYVGGKFDVPLSLFHYVRFYSILILITFMVFNMNKKFYDFKSQMILHGLLIYLISYGLSFQFAPILRISNYFKIFEIIFLGYFYKDLFKINPKLIIFITLTMYLGLYVGIAIMDPYDITGYDFELLRLFEDRPDFELYQQIINETFN